MIDISQEDFGTLCICALRYCHGRRTYMPRLVQEIVGTHFEDLSDKDLKVIAADKKYQTTFNAWGDAHDRAEWECFYKKLTEFMSAERGLQ